MAVLRGIQGSHGPRPRAYGSQKGPHIVKDKGPEDVLVPGPAVPNTAVEVNPLKEPADLGSCKRNFFTVAC